MQAGVPQRSASTRILIVEDNELNLKLLNDILEFRGYATIVTGNGAAAVELAHQHHPDLILLDIQLPDISGIEVARRLKADSETNAIPIIAITAFAMPGDRAMILEGGCDDYMSKPININDFLALVEHYIGETSREGAPQS